MKRYSMTCAAVLLGLVAALSAVDAAAHPGGRAPGGAGGGGGGGGGGGRPVGGGGGNPAPQHMQSFNNPQFNRNFQQAPHNVQQGAGNVQAFHPPGQGANGFQHQGGLTPNNFGGAGHVNLPPRQNFNRPTTFPGGNLGPGGNPGAGHLPNQGIAGNPPGGLNRPGNPAFGHNTNNINGQNNFNRNNFDHNRTNIGHNNVNNFARFNNVNANHFGMGWSGYHTGNNYGNWYHGNWHGHWGPGWHSYPVGWGYGYGGYGGSGGYGGYGGYGLGYGGYALAGLASAGLINAAAPWSWGYYGYSNPYYADGSGGWNGYDYSQPLAFAQAPVDPAQAVAVADPQVAAGAAEPNPNDVAASAFDVARDLFKQGNYAEALKQVDVAIAGNPSDPVMHEFRALCQFAIGDYKQAAATIYAVLSVGPGWDWTTVANLYASVDDYTQQLRALEAFRQANPAAADARFVLAYQYLLQGYTDAAANELKAVVQIQPDNQLATQLLKSLSAPDTAVAANDAQPTPAAASADQPPAVDPAALPGNWRASGPDGAKFGLAITNDGKFDWQFTRDGKTQDIKGTYKVQDNNLLVLQGGDNNNLVGQVAMLPNNQMNFKLAGQNPADPGLTFTR